MAFIAPSSVTSGHTCPCPPVRSFCAASRRRNAGLTPRVTTRGFFVLLSKARISEFANGLAGMVGGFEVYFAPV